MNINYIYESIIKDYFNLDQANIRELSRYKQSIINLRKSYKSDICVPMYSTDKDRDSYMLAYFPHYSILTSEVIKKIKEYINIKQKMNVSIFGCGPAPEIIGVSNQINTQRIIYNLFDYENGWKNQREFAKQYIKKNYSSQFVFSEISGCDLLSKCEDCSISNSKCIKKIEETDLFIMQNCLNHITNVSDFIEKISYLINNSKENSIFIFIDLNNYKVSKRLFREIIVKNSDKCKKIDEQHSQKINRNIINKEIKEYLFTGEKGLIPKTNVNYMYLVIKRI